MSGLGRRRRTPIEIGHRRLASIWDKQPGGEWALNSLLEAPHVPFIKITRSVQTAF